MFKGAVVLAAGREVGIVVVEPLVLQSAEKSEEVRVMASRAFGPRTFGYVPIVLVAFDENGIPTYSGSFNDVNLLAEVDPQLFPWEHYEF